MTVTEAKTICRNGLAGKSIQRLKAIREVLVLDAGEKDKAAAK